MKGKRIDTEDVWEETMFEERKLATTARKIIMTPGTHAKCYWPSWFNASKTWFPSHAFRQIYSISNSDIFLEISLFPICQFDQNCSSASSGDHWLSARATPSPSLICCNSEYCYSVRHSAAPATTGLAEWYPRVYHTTTGFFWSTQPTEGIWSLLEPFICA